jgi:hypothetical protein
MSHFSNIKTQIRNLASLQAALTDLGVDWKSGPCPVRGYRGQTRTAEVAIEQDNDYDIGFINRVMQRYAYHTVMSEASKQGFQVAEEQQNKDGSIRLVVQRWSA